MIGLNVEETPAPSPAVILVYGRDPKLLHSRGLLLQKTGLEIVQASELEQACQLLIERSPVLLVLCHTVTQEDAECILDKAAGIKSAPQSIILTAHGKGCSVANCGTSVDVYDGPRALLASVKNVLHLESYLVQ